MDKEKLVKEILILTFFCSYMFYKTKDKIKCEDINIFSKELEEVCHTYINKL